MLGLGREARKLQRSARLLHHLNGASDASHASSASTTHRVLAITKCRIWVPRVNRLTVVPKVLKQCRAQRLDGPFAGFIQRSTIMPKENELTNQRELTEQELEFVAGGFPDVMEWFFGPYFSLLLNDGSNCPASVCGTQH
jgi:hypothetical protein